MDERELRRVAWRVRRAAEVYAARLGFPSGLRGACTVVSRGLCSALREAGEPATMVAGLYFIRNGRDATHAWVETASGWTIDLTATQFPGDPTRRRVVILRTAQAKDRLVFERRRAVILEAARRARCLLEFGIDPAVVTSRERWWKGERRAAA